MRQVSRCALFAAVSLLLVVPAAAAAMNNCQHSFWILTYLKAKPNQGDNLLRFLEKNRSELEQISTEQNLIKQ